MNSRLYQNILHVTGTVYTVLTILGAVLIGKDNTALGIIIMVIGGIAVRISSEVEYRKQRELFKEYR